MKKEWEIKFGKILDDYMNASVDENKLKKLEEIHANIKKKLIEMEASRQLRKKRTRKKKKH